jgi:hypothetical protein
MSEMKGLDPAMITELMGNTRSRNTYGPKLLDFINSDEAAINPAENWPIDFGNKKATALYQGFLNAAKTAELTDVVLVKQYDGGVYLLHKERANVVINPPADEPEDDDNDTELELGDAVTTEAE